MSVPVIVVTAEPAGDAADARAIADAASEALPPGTRVEVASAETPRADARVMVRWADDAHSRATLHVEMRDGRTTDRDIGFDRADPEAERVRAVGYAIAAMIPEDLRGEEENLSKREAPSPPVTAALTPPTRLRDHVWIDASVQGAIDSGGTASEGGGVAVRVPIGAFALRIGGAARTGELAGGASTLLVRGDAGMSYAVPITAHVLAGGRGGLVLLRRSAHRDDPASGASSDVRVLFGAEALAEAAWVLTPNAAILAAAGAETAFGTTTVYAGGARVATIPPLRFVGEIGARVAF